MKKTLEPPAPRPATRTNWIPLLTALLGVGTGVLGTLSYQHFKPQAAPRMSLDSESSTRFAREAVPEELKHVVPSFDAAPTTNAATTGNAATANAPSKGGLGTASKQEKAQAALSQGNTLYDGQNWNQAALQYEQAIAGGLDNANVRTDLGNCYRFLEQPQKALEQYRLAQKLNPQHEQSLFNQGGLYAFSLKDNAKAIAKWREYLRRFPQGATVAEARQLIAQAQSGQLPTPPNFSATPQQ